MKKQSLNLLISSVLLVSGSSSLKAAPAGNTYDMAIIGDAGLVGPELNALKDSIERTPVRSLILTGDNNYLGSYRGIWEQWKRSKFKFEVVAIGNHHDGYSKEISYFGMPGEFYTVVRGGARFIVLNSDNESNLESQMSFLDQELSQAQESLVFLVYHHPTYTVGSDDNWKQREKFQLQMRPRLLKYKDRISGILLGHAHISAILKYGEIPAIVAGSGREVLRASAVNYVEDSLSIRTQYLAPRDKHWAQLRIAADAKSAVIDFIRVSDNYPVCSVQIYRGGLQLFGACKP